MIQNKSDEEVTEKKSRNLAKALRKLPSSINQFFVQLVTKKDKQKERPRGVHNWFLYTVVLAGLPFWSRILLMVLNFIDNGDFQTMISRGEFLVFSIAIGINTLGIVSFNAKSKSFQKWFYEGSLKRERVTDEQIGGIFDYNEVTDIAEKGLGVLAFLSLIMYLLNQFASEGGEVLGGYQVLISIVLWLITLALSFVCIQAIDGVEE